MRTPLFALLALALLAAGCATPAANAPTKITLAVQPTDNAAAIQAQAKDLEAFLEAGMKSRGVSADVEILVPLTYVGVVEALRFHHADAAMMSAWPAVMASTKADAEIVLAEQREVIVGEKPTVGPYYYSYYVVLKDSPVKTLADLRGKSVAFPSSTSTSGYIFPVAKLVSDGLLPVEAGKEATPLSFFGEVRFAGGYAQAWEALKAGQVDAAVIAGDVNAKLYHDVLSQTRVIAEQGPVPSHAVVFSDDLVGAERDALQGAFLDLKGEHKDLMRKLVSGIFVEFKPTTTGEHAAGLSEALVATNIRFSEKLG